MVVHLKICALAFVPRNVYKYKNLLTFDFISAADKILSCLNQEHTNHAEPELAEIQKVNLRSEIVKIAIIPTSLGYGQPYMAEGTNG